MLEQEGATWHAQALEYDLGGWGSTVESAKKSVERAIASAIGAAVARGTAPLGNFPPAPQEFHERFAKVLREELAGVPHPAVIAAQLASKSQYASS